MWLASMKFASVFGGCLALVGLSNASSSSTHHQRSDALCNGNHEAHDDFVPHMPGYDQPTPGLWFSGFLTYEFQGRTIHTHYMLVGQEFMDGEEQPLIWWSNGGPGASSMFGLLTEVGPMMFSENSRKTDGYRETGIPTPVYNRYAWTRLGSVLMIDQPAPVGCSYCNDDQISPSCAGLVWNDELASANAYLALQTFYKKFPCLKERDLYLTGESYAGIYIPTLARRIVQDPNSGIPLKGLAVGDGCLGTETGICTELTDENYTDPWKVFFLVGHGQIPLKTFIQYKSACFTDEDSIFGGDNTRRERQTLRQSCQQVKDLIKKQSAGFFTYSLYDDCSYSAGLLQQGGVGDAINDYACGGDEVMQEYLKKPAVMKALHLEGCEFFETDNARGFAYQYTEKDISGFYKEINGKLRVLIYNGDTDPDISSFIAQNWTSHMGFEEVQSWRGWTLDSCRRMGGYVTRYEGDFDFLTIRGAGHMVPTYKPEATYVFLKAWLENNDYPVYDEACSFPPSKAPATAVDDLASVDERAERE